MTLFARTCRDVARLLIEREHRALGPVERIAVRVHLRLCDMCTRFAGQLDLMNRALTHWKAYTEPSEADDPRDDGPGTA